MKYKKSTFFFCFTILFTANLFGQEIKIRFDRATCQINENIIVTYEIPIKYDSIQKINLNQFEKISGPAKNFGTTHLNGEVTYVNDITYRFKATTLGKQKLPQLYINSNGIILKSEDFFINVVNNPLASERLNFKEYKAGHSFYVSIPTYMKKTSGINAFSAIEYQSAENNLFGVVLYDKKENLALEGKTYKSIKDFYESMINVFFEEGAQKEVSLPKYEKKELINFIETDVSYFDKEKKQKFYYFIGVAETGTTFYTFVSWVPIERKEAFKRDFQQILYSLKD